MLTLESPSAHHKASFICAANAYLAALEAKPIERYPLAVNDFDGFLVSLENMASGLGLATTWVPMHTYFLVQDQNMVVGIARLRPALTPALELDGGHIGYDIVPGYRNLGYGTELLRLTLQKAQALGLAKVILTTESNNIGSTRIIERNGGQFRRAYLSPASNAPMRRYIIDIANQPSA